MLVKIFWSLVFAVAFSLSINSGGLADLEGQLRAMPVGFDVIVRGGLPGEGERRAVTLLAALLVLGLFARRFNGWPNGARGPAGFPEHGPRYFTTRFRFCAWALLYGSVIAGAFLVVVFFPTLADQAVALLFPVMPGNPFLSQIDKVLPSAPPGGGTQWSLAAAVGIAAAFYTSDWERMLRERFQNNALIPRQAEQLFEEFTRFEAVVPVESHFGDRFMMQFRERDDLPTYHRIDLDPEQSELAQMRLERLARVEFMLWRMTQGDLPAEVAARLAEHVPLRQRLLDKLAAIRDEALAIDLQLVQVTNLLLCHLAEAQQPDFRRRLGQAAGLDCEQDRIETFPVSRLDDVIPVLEDELRRIAEAEPVPTGWQGGGDGAAGQAIEALQEQVASLRALVPLCVTGLEVQRGRLRDLSARLEDLWYETLRFAICIGLAAPYASGKRFFCALGLRARMGYDVNLSIVLAVPMGLCFFCAVALLSGQSSDHAAGANPEGAELWQRVRMLLGGMKIAATERPLWLILGGFFIGWPLLQGCYVGSALAHGRQIEGGFGRPGALRPLDYLISFVMIWSVLVPGVAALIYVLGFSAAFRDVYVGALAYAPVSALWGVMVSITSMRAFDTQAEGPAIRIWESVIFLLLVAVGVVVAEIWIGSVDPESDTPFNAGRFWNLLFLASALTMVLIGAILLATSSKVSGKLQRMQGARLTPLRPAYPA